jgi:SAM-dependent methyltransferase
MTVLPAAPVSPLVTGAEYVRQITARGSDRRARAAFQQLALQLAPARATVFDFGCGAGLDACRYAAEGRAVIAYDVDRSMCQYFAMHCAQHIAQGNIRLEGGPYADFIARRRHDAPWRAALVTANFAPLNLIGDLHELFAVFHAVTLPEGKVLASVLNPFFLGDLRYFWWWRHLLPLLRTGSFALPGAQAAIHRRRVREFAAQSAPYFTLERVLAGLPACAAAAEGMAGPLRPQLLTCRFLFLLFSRQAVSHSAAAVAEQRGVEE